MNEVWFALGLTTFAGLATGIGSIIAFTAKLSSYRFLSVATGFSAGVMLYVSFVEIFFKGQESLVAHYGDPTGYWVNVASFFGGMLVIGLIDNLIPEETNPHEIPAEAEADLLHGKSSSLWDIGKNSRSGSKAPVKPLPGHEKSSCAWDCSPHWLSEFTIFPRGWLLFWLPWRIQVLVSPSPSPSHSITFPKA